MKTEVEFRTAFEIEQKRLASKRDLQQRMVDAVYGRGQRRSDTVEDLVEALIAIATVTPRRPASPSIGRVVKPLERQLPGRARGR